MAKQSKKFPAAILVPGIVGWLFHTVSLLEQVGLLQVVFTTAIDPTSVAVTAGLSAFRGERSGIARGAVLGTRCALGRSESFRHRETTCEEIENTYTWCNREPAKLVNKYITIYKCFKI